MVQEMGRRRAIATSLGVLAAAGIGTTAAGRPAAAEPAEGQPDCPFPPVPGMVGDRRANEFWYQYDEKFLYHPSPEILQAFAICLRLFGSFDQFVEKWRESRRSADYPTSFVALAAQAKPQLAVISSAQIDHINEYYRHNRRGLSGAFADIGMGCLYDPRRGPGEKAHMMGTGNPTAAWHRWHVITRAMMFLDIDKEWWAGVLPMIGYGWVVQTIADPKVDAYNPRLPAATLSRLERAWLRKSSRELDKDFDSFPYPPGYED